MSGEQAQPDILELIRERGGNILLGTRGIGIEKDGITYIYLPPIEDVPEFARDQYPKSTTSSVGETPKSEEIKPPNNNS